MFGFPGAAETPAILTTATVDYKVLMGFLPPAKALKIRIPTRYSRTSWLVDRSNAHN